MVEFDTGQPFYDLLLDVHGSIKPAQITHVYSASIVTLAFQENQIYKHNPLLVVQLHNNSKTNIQHLPSIIVSTAHSTWIHITLYECPIASQSFAPNTSNMGKFRT